MKCCLDPGGAWLEQAQDRSGGKHGNKGVEAAVAALQMADLKPKQG